MWRKKVESCCPIISLTCSQLWLGLQSSHLPHHSTIKDGLAGNSFVKNRLSPISCKIYLFTSISSFFIQHLHTFHYLTIITILFIILDYCPGHCCLRQTSILCTYVLYVWCGESNHFSPEGVTSESLSIFPIWRFIYLFTSFILFIYPRPIRAEWSHLKTF